MLVNGIIKENFLHVNEVRTCSWESIGPQFDGGQIESENENEWYSKVQTEKGNNRRGEGSG